MISVHCSNKDHNDFRSDKEYIKSMESDSLLGSSVLENVIDYSTNDYCYTTFIIVKFNNKIAAYAVLSGEVVFNSFDKPHYYGHISNFSMPLTGYPEIYNVEKTIIKSIITAFNKSEYITITSNINRDYIFKKYGFYRVDYMLYYNTKYSICGLINKFIMRYVFA